MAHNARIGNGNSLEDEMSKFEQELSMASYQLGPQFMPRAGVGSALAFRPQVLIRPQAMPLAPPPRPPSFCFALTAPAQPHSHSSLASNFIPPKPMQMQSQPEVLATGNATSNAHMQQHVFHTTADKFEPSNLVIESRPSIYKTPKQPNYNPVTRPGPVPIAPQIKNPQPVSLPPALAESLNAPVNNMGSAGGFATSAVAKNSQASSSAQKQKIGATKPKKFVRAAGGETWEDMSLHDWDPNDFRVFCGDLGNEVSDDHLRRAFSQYPSLQRVKVVRDKRTNKTKGYGFLSFSDSADYVRAMKEMNGKYVGNRPIKLRKSSWQERDIHQVRKKEKLKKKLGLR
ncbi:RNA-binding protein 42-like [Symsagittifera roscoffensis]|uniref:RNA-binding protein 42-like n=1 Tax=Symsagittifera roscoffensis TaxID=84072 RepID=UPI00307B1B06